MKIFTRSLMMILLVFGVAPTAGAEPNYERTLNVITHRTGGKETNKTQLLKAKIFKQKADTLLTEVNKNLNNTESLNVNDFEKYKNNYKIYIQKIKQDRQKIDEMHKEAADLVGSKISQLAKNVYYNINPMLNTYIDNQTAAVAVQGTTFKRFEVNTKNNATEDEKNIRNLASAIKNVYVLISKVPNTSLVNFKSLLIKNMSGLNEVTKTSDFKPNDFGTEALFETIKESINGITQKAYIKNIIQVNKSLNDELLPLLQQALEEYYICFPTQAPKSQQQVISQEKEQTLEKEETLLVKKLPPQSLIRIGKNVAQNLVAIQSIIQTTAPNLLTQTQQSTLKQMVTSATFLANAIKNGTATKTILTQGLNFTQSMINELKKKQISPQFDSLLKLAATKGRNKDDLIKLFYTINGNLKKLIDQSKVQELPAISYEPAKEPQQEKLTVTEPVDEQIIQQKAPAPLPEYAKEHLKDKKLNLRKNEQWGPFLTPYQLEEILTCLKDNDQITELSLKSQDLRNVSFGSFLNLNKITTLDVSYCQLSPDKIEDILTLTQLQDLDLSGNKLDNLSTINSFSKLTNLTRLRVCNCDLPPNQIYNILMLNQLQELDLSINFRLDNVTSALKFPVSLIKLNIGKNIALKSHEHIKPLLALKNLQELNIEDTKLDEKGQELLKEFHQINPNCNITSLYPLPKIDLVKVYGSASTTIQKIVRGQKARKDVKQKKADKQKEDIAKQQQQQQELEVQQRAEKFQGQLQKFNPNPELYNAQLLFNAINKVFALIDNSKQDLLSKVNATPVNNWLKQTPGQTASLFFKKGLPANFSYSSSNIVTTQPKTKNLQPILTTFKKITEALDNETNEQKDTFLYSMLVINKAKNGQLKTLLEEAMKQYNNCYPEQK